MDLVRVSALVSIARGLVGLVAPRSFARIADAKPNATRTRLLFGAREVAIGTGLLTTLPQRPFLQARLGGDLVDIALHTRELVRKRASRRTKVVLALVIAAVLVDLWLLDVD